MLCGFAVAHFHFKQGSNMDTNALYPRCPYCGLPMQFKGGSFSALQAYECSGCDVILDIAAQTEGAITLKEEQFQ